MMIKRNAYPILKKTLKSVYVENSFLLSGFPLFFKVFAFYDTILSFF